MKTSTLVYSVLIIIVGFILVLGIFIYAFGLNNDFAKKAEKVIPYPAVIINYSHAISISELNSNLDSVKKFYESQDFSEVNLRVDFSTEDGKKRLKLKEKEILNRMIEDRAIEIIAAKKGIKISNDAVTQNLNRKLEEYGTGDDLKNNLERLYGWSVSDFENKIIKPDLYRQALEDLFSKENPTTAEAKKQIESAQSELDKKKDFAEVAKKYSKGSTAENGGELGWFSQDQLVSDIAEKVFSLNKGSRSDILESPLGFHIVEVEDKKTENGVDLVRIRQVFSPKKTFNEYLGEEMGSMNFMVFEKGYSWNKDSETLEFKNEDMKNFEKETILNPQGDASVLF